MFYRAIQTWLNFIVSRGHFLHTQVQHTQERQVLALACIWKSLPISNLDAFS